MTKFHKIVQNDIAQSSPFCKISIKFLLETVDMARPKSVQRVLPALCMATKAKPANSAV